MYSLPIPRCRGCGANVEPTTTTCEYCGGPVRIATLTTAAQLNTATLLRYKKSYEDAASTDTSERENALGNILLRLGQHALAAAQFELAIGQNPMCANAYLGRCLALMGGKRPFLLPRKSIDQVLCDIESAHQIEANPIYKFVAAYVRYDYFFLKGFRTSPTYQEELALAKGAARGDIDAILSTLRASPPEEFFF